jgi:hypothetical protein
MTMQANLSFQNRMRMMFMMDMCNRAWAAEE